MNNPLYIDINDVQTAILLGLRKYGRSRTFSQILDEMNLFADGRGRVEAAFALEAGGYIQSVTYQLPVAIRAELSSMGKEIADKLFDEHRLTPRGNSTSGVN